MTKLEKLLKWYPEHDFMTADGFDEAIIGVQVTDGRVVYDCKVMVQILMETDNMTEEDALEYIEYNVVGAYVGENTPIYVNMLGD